MHLFGDGEMNIIDLVFWTIKTMLETRTMFVNGVWKLLNKEDFSYFGIFVLDLVVKHSF